MPTRIEDIELVLILLLFFVALVGVLAQRLKQPYSILLVIVGLILALVPGMPKVALTPSIFFMVFLPPLLYNTAWNTPWPALRRNLFTIVALSFGLVGITVISVGWMAEHFIKDLYLQTGLLLGAIIAPTDALAATSIGRRIGLPPAVLSILEGESLFNDATGLLALEFALGMIVEGTHPTFIGGLTRLIYLVALGVAIGLLFGAFVYYATRLIRNANVEITVSLLVPYAAYICAERFSASGVLAVVACGLFLGHMSADQLTPAVRLQLHAVWDSIEFVLNGLAFILIGLQLQIVTQALAHYSRRTLLIDAIMLAGFVVLVRVAWTYFAVWMSNKHNRDHHPERGLRSPKETFVIGWTGMRGVLSLAAVLAVPTVLKDGSPFPGRPLIVFLTFSVIFFTLVVQGLTLPTVIRRLKLNDRNDGHEESKLARKTMLQAAFDCLGNFDTSESINIMRAIYSGRLRELELGPKSVQTPASEQSAIDPAILPQNAWDLSRYLISVERHAAHRLHENGQISDELMRRLQHELDLSQSRFEDQ